VIEDLARARPNIRVSELARLLNLDAGVAHALAARVARDRGVQIDFDQTAQ
jgi:hypothetical protein